MNEPNSSKKFFAQLSNSEDDEDDDDEQDNEDNLVVLCSSVWLYCYIVYSDSSAMLTVLMGHFSNGANANC